MPNPHASEEGRDVALDAALALLTNGYLRIYNGTQPANANASLGAAVLLSEHRFGATAFAPAASGSASANLITTATSVATARASFFRCLKADGTSAILDGDAGDAGDLPSVPNLILGNANIQVNTSVTVTALTVSIPA